MNQCRVAPPRGATLFHGLVGSGAGESVVTDAAAGIRGAVDQVQELPQL